ncbi:MAG: divergent polysaccharide deacetylase family protein [Parvibaculum sp.]|uniref:divergent polysaccharide deacetylase family protein n=1 Tax=Parvibaculum sp. TaxID=2024848 RepID=UPI003C71D70F
MPGRALSDRSKRRRQPGVLAVAALLIACLYGGVLAWLLTVDSRMAGMPAVQLALAPEPEPAALPAPPAENLLRTGNDEEHAAAATPSETPDETHAPDDAAADGLSPDEQTLLDAARNVGADNSGDVKIVGAETVSANDPAATVAIALKPVPDPALIANGRQGPLPIVAKDGRQAWKVYARPLPKGLPAGPRVALIVSGLGISDSATAHAIETLPPEVTLSFAPYGARLQDWITKARAAGHEVLLELPMEPFGYPQNDPGPYTLLTSLQPAENISRLEWLMSRFTGYAGVMNYQGARFTSSETSVTPILAAVKSRGLMYVDNGASQRSLAPKLAADISLPHATGTRMIDPVQTPDVIAYSLVQLEASAKQSGTAIGVASGLPVTVDELARWAVTLKNRGVTLVPVTATAN